MKLAGVFISCAVLILAASPAEAKKGKKPTKLGPVVTVTAPGNVSTGGTGISVATATCPFPKQAVGGGFSAPLSDATAVIVHDSYRSSPRTWTVTGIVLEGTGAVTAHAYCRNGKGHPITDVSMSAVLSSSGEVKTLEPSCTTGKLVGGGFQATRILADNPFVFPQVNQASSPTTWTVTGVANQDGPRTLTAHAYCMAKIKQPPIVSMPVSGPASHVAPMTTESPSCPAPMTKIKGKKRKKTPRKLLSAGGFSTTVNGVPGAPVMVLSESHLGVGGGWQASALSANNTPGAVTLTSQGICF